MAKFWRLDKYTNQIIPTGYKIRVPSSNGYEEIVDYMVCEDSSTGQCRLITSSGYKGGSTRRLFPKESGVEGWGYALSTEWLKANWEKWGFGNEVKIEEVWVLESSIPIALDLAEGFVKEIYASKKISGS